MLIYNLFDADSSLWLIAAFHPVCPSSSKPTPSSSGFLLSASELPSTSVKLPTLDSRLEEPAQLEDSVLASFSFPAFVLRASRTAIVMRANSMQNPRTPPVMIPDLVPLLVVSEEGSGVGLAVDDDVRTKVGVTADRNVPVDPGWIVEVVDRLVVVSVSELVLEGRAEGG